jgi:glycosyltransferase involved in cell wall biosynthesis
MRMHHSRDTGHMSDGEERLLALIPAYEEAARIADVVAAAHRHLPVLVVDDGSTDATAQLAERAGARVIRQVPNAGKGAALCAGFRVALDEGVDAVITLDADGQHDPDEIPSFVAAFAIDRPELVIGERDTRSMPPVRRASNVAGGALLAMALGRRVPDNQSGYRLIGRTLMRAMLDSEESGFEFEVEMIARCLALGLPMASVPIRTIYAGEASHIRPWRHLTEFLRIARKARRIARGDAATHSAAGSDSA